MRAELLNPSKYLKAAEFGTDFEREPTFTIVRVDFEELEDTKGQAERKGVVHFKETPKGWVVNVINVKCLIAMFGKETDAWTARRVTLFEDPNVKSFGEIVSGIRVRGSPDLPRGLSVTMRTRGKKEIRMELVKTGAKPAGAAKARELSADADVVFRKSPHYGKRIAELGRPELLEVIVSCTEVLATPELTTDQLATLQRADAALRAELAKRDGQGEPGAGG